MEDQLDSLYEKMLSISGLSGSRNSQSGMIQVIEPMNNTDLASSLLTLTPPYTNTILHLIIEYAKRAGELPASGLPYNGMDHKGASFDTKNFPMNLKVILTAFLRHNSLCGTK